MRLPDVMPLMPCVVALSSIDREKFDTIFHKPHFAYPGDKNIKLSAVSLLLKLSRCCTLFVHSCVKDSSVKRDVETVSLEVSLEVSVEASLEVSLEGDK